MPKRLRSNFALEPTRNSPRSSLAPAIARGSPPALGCYQSRKHQRGKAHMKRGSFFARPDVVGCSGRWEDLG
jgi:hypothetical protein